METMKFFSAIYKCVPSLVTFQNINITFNNFFLFEFKWSDFPRPTLCLQFMCCPVVASVCRLSLVPK